MALYENNEMERAAMALLERLGYINAPEYDVVTITTAGIAALLDTVAADEVDAIRNELSNRCTDCNDKECDYPKCKEVGGK
jgi:hypothetical protein